MARVSNAANRVRDKVADASQRTAHHPATHRCRLLHETGKGYERKSDQELVELIAKALADYPDQIVVSEINSQQTTVIELRAAKQDLGKIIGKQGRNAQALRTIVNAAATKLRKRAVLEILD